MKQTVGYLMALFLGLFIGWLAQQFWFIGRDAEYTLPSERDIARYQSRLESLKKQETIPEKIPSVVTLAEVKVDTTFDKLIAQENFEAALVWLQNNEPGSLSKALRVAELGFDRQQFEQLLYFLYDVRLLLDARDEQSLLQEIAVLVERMDQQLMAEQDIPRLVDIYRTLIALEAENSYYYLRLSYWLLQAGETFQAKEVLNGAVNDIRYAADFKQLNTLIDQTEKGRLNVLVPLEQAGDHFLVSVIVNDQFEARLMLDTGATKTVLKSEFEEQFQGAEIRQGTLVSLSTANGQAEGLALNVDTLSLADAELKAVDIVLMELDGFRHDGLLGMNVLNQFEFSIDQLNSQLILRPKLHATIQR